MSPKNDSNTPQFKNTHSEVATQKCTTTQGSIPVLWAWAVEIQEEELLPNERQKRMIRRCGQSLVGPAVDQQPLQRWDDGEFQLGLSFLQERKAVSCHEMNIHNQSF